MKTMLCNRGRCLGLNLTWCAGHASPQLLVLVPKPLDFSPEFQDELHLGVQKPYGAIADTCAGHTVCVWGGVEEGERGLIWIIGVWLCVCEYVSIFECACVCGRLGRRGKRGGGGGERK